MKDKINILLHYIIAFGSDHHFSRWMSTAHYQVLHHCNMLKNCGANNQKLLVTFGDTALRVT